MTRAEQIEQLAQLVAVQLGDASLDVMGPALVLNLASVITGYPRDKRERTRMLLNTMLSARIEQLAAAGEDEVLESNHH